jgi:hypothetical protein
VDDGLPALGAFKHAGFSRTPSIHRDLSATAIPKKFGALKFKLRWPGNNETSNIWNTKENAGEQELTWPNEATLAAYIVDVLKDCATLAHLKAKLQVAAVQHL